MFSVDAALAARLKIEPTEAGIQSLKRRCPKARQPEHLEDYLRFLALKVGAGDYHATLLSPPLVVDTIWHAHLLDNLHYEELCSIIGARTVYHNPEGGLDATARDERLARAKRLYTQTFGLPPGGNWGHGAQKRGGDLASLQPPTTEQKTDAAPVADTINLKLQTQDGGEIVLKCKRTTQLANVIAAFYTRASIEPGTCRFLFGGETLRAYRTPEAMDMEDGDVIDVMTEQSGC